MITCLEGKFPRIVVSDDAHLTTEGLEPYAEAALALLELHGLPVHIQNTKQITHLIMYPEGWNEKSPRVD